MGSGKSKTRVSNAGASQPTATAPAKNTASATKTEEFAPVLPGAVETDGSKAQIVPDREPSPPAQEEPKPEPPPEGSTANAGSSIKGRLAAGRRTLDNLWQESDLNADNLLDQDEVEKLLSGTGVNKSFNWRSFDGDGDGKLTKDEFLQAAQAAMEQTNASQEDEEEPQPEEGPSPLPQQSFGTSDNFTSVTCESKRESRLSRDAQADAIKAAEAAGDTGRRVSYQEMVAVYPTDGGKEAAKERRSLTGAIGAIPDPVAFSEAPDPNGDKWQNAKCESSREETGVTYDNDNKNRLIAGSEEMRPGEDESKIHPDRDSKGVVIDNRVDVDVVEETKEDDAARKGNSGGIGFVAVSKDEMQNAMNEDSRTGNEIIGSSADATAKAETGAGKKKAAMFEEPEEDSSAKKGQGMKVARKGTGFVGAGDLPDSDDEDEDDEPPSKGGGGGGGVKFDAPEEDEKSAPAHGVVKSAGGMSRKGTGFVACDELPDSDDEDDDDEAANTTSQGHGGVKFNAPEESEKQKASGDASGGKLARKGTGFVAMGELPSSDEEEEEEETKSTTVSGGASGKVKMAEPQKDENEPKKEGKSVSRKGTGFVSCTDLPDSDSEDEEEEKEKKGVQFNAKPGQGEAKDKGSGGKVARKGTGFVNCTDLPDSDDEDEEEEEEKPAKAPAKKGGGGGGGVKFGEGEKEEKKESDKGGGKMARKGTGFVALGDMPMSDDEDEEEEEQPKKAKKGGVQIQEAPGQKKSGNGGGGSLARKGTGFVAAGDMDFSDDDEEEEEKPEPPKPKKKAGPKFQADDDDDEKDGGAVKFKVDPKAKEQGKPKDNAGSKISRKGTGFVAAGDMDFSDDEEEDEEEAKPKKGVQIAAKGSEGDGDKGGGNKMSRKGTGFVNLADMGIDSDEEEDDDDAPAKGAKKGVQIQNDGKTGEGKKTGGGMCRKGTGFVAAGDMDFSDDDDEEEEEAPKGGKKGGKGVQISAPAGQGAGDKKAGGGLSRKGTGYVNMSEMDFSDEEDEEEEEKPPPPPPKGKKKAGVQEEPKKGKSGPKFADDDGDGGGGGSSSGKKVQVTGDDNEGKKKAGGGLSRKGTGFVSAGDMDFSDEEESEEDNKGKQKKHVGIKEAPKSAKADKPDAGGGSKINRKGTGFVAMGDMDFSDEEDEEDEGPPKKGVQISDDAKTKDGKKKGEGGGSLARKGTGFVAAGDMDFSEDEDESEEEKPAPKAKGKGKAAPKKKAAGFAAESDDDEPKGKDSGKHAKFGAGAKASDGADKAKAGGGLSRKGTGYVSMNDMDFSDSEEEEDSKEKKHVQMSAPAGSKDKEDNKKAGGGLSRKGTGFVAMTDLGSDSEEDEEEESGSKKHVQLAVDASAGSGSKKDDSKLARKGTGFVALGELPDSDDEDEEEDSPPPKKKAGPSFGDADSDDEPKGGKKKKGVQISSDAQEKTGAHTNSKVARKGTGFVDLNELPSESEEDD